MRNTAKVYSKLLYKKLHFEMKKVLEFAQKTDLEMTPDRNDPVNLILAKAMKAIEQRKGLKVRNNQIITALALSKGMVAELDTGEGKSVAVCLGAILMGLRRKVYIATVNEYLARRDAEEFVDIYSYFGLTVKYNFTGADKADIYSADIVYTSSMELIFDYLQESHRVHGYGMKLEGAILDEIDFILMDNANSTFSISEGSVQLDDQADFIFALELCSKLRGSQGYMGIHSLEEDPDCDYIYIPTVKDIYVTNKGIKHLTDIYSYKALIQDGARLYNTVLNCLKAVSCYKKDVDYIVKNHRIVLINRENGCPMDSSQYQYELQRAIEVKENCISQHHGNYSDGMSYQIFFSKFGLWGGLSGTIADVEEELSQIFGKETVLVPRYTKSIRVDEEDRFFRTTEAKLQALVEEGCKMQEAGMPVVIVCTNEMEAETIYQSIREREKTQLLRASNLDRQTETVANAGKPGFITVTTSLLGRGVHIETTDEVNMAGGLAVILTSKFDCRRIENQVRGRTGRQGNPGMTRCYISLEDNIWNNLVKSEVKHLDKIRSKEIFEPEDVWQVHSLMRKINERLYYRHLYLRSSIYRLELIQDNYRDRFFSVCKKLRDGKDSLSDIIAEMTQVLAEPGTEDASFQEMKNEVMTNLEHKIDRFGNEVVFKLVFAIALKTIIQYYSSFREFCMNLNTHYVLAMTMQKTQADFIREVQNAFMEFYRDMIFEILDLMYRADVKEKIVS